MAMQIERINIPIDNPPQNAYIQKQLVPLREKLKPFLGMMEMMHHM